MIPRTLLFVMAAVAIGGAQPVERTFQVGVTGSTPAGRGSPQAALNDPGVRPVVLAIAEAPLPVAEAEARLKPSTYTVAELAKLGLLAVKDGRALIAFNYLSAEDQRRLKTRAQVYGRDLAALILAQRAAIESAARPLARSDAELRQMLFFVVGCIGLDWDGLDFTRERGYRSGPTVKGDTFEYTPWMKENAPDISRRGLYWGSHNFDTGGFTMTSFGDHHSLPRRSFPDVFNNQVNPFTILATPDNAALSGRRMLTAYIPEMFQDSAAVILAMHRGQRTRNQVAGATGLTANRVNAIVDVLKSLNLVVEEGDQLRSRYVVMTEEAEPATKKIRAIVREAMDNWHRQHYATVKKELGDLTAVKQGTSFETMYTEIWHYVFGYANLYLSEAGLLIDPYADGWPFPGFVPVVWANVLSAVLRS